MSDAVGARGSAETSGVADGRLPGRSRFPAAARAAFPGRWRGHLPERTQRMVCAGMQAAVVDHPRAVRGADGKTDIAIASSLARRRGPRDPIARRVARTRTDVPRSRPSHDRDRMHDRDM